MKKAVAFIVLALMTFTAFVVVLAPAAAVWRYIEPKILPNMPELEVVSIQGTVWTGEADIFYRQFPPSHLNWSTSPIDLLSSLLDPTLVADLKLAGEGHEFVGDIIATENSVTVPMLEGFVDSLYINRVSQPQGLTFVGRVDVNKLSLKSDTRWVQKVDGHIYWPGGKIISRTRAAGTRVFDLPPLEGILDMQGNNIRLTIRQESRNEPLLDIVLKPDGWVVVAVKARLFDIAGLPWPSGSSPQDTVLQFEEKLLRGIQ